MPHGELSKHLDHVKCMCPTISRGMINRDMQLYYSNLMSEDRECGLVSSENNSESCDYSI